MAGWGGRLETDAIFALETNLRVSFKPLPPLPSRLLIIMPPTQLSHCIEFLLPPLSCGNPTEPWDPKWSPPSCSLPQRHLSGVSARRPLAQF